VSDKVSDRLELSDLLDTYARGIDTKDWDVVASVFTPDASLDYTAFGGPKGSPADVIGWVSASVSAFPMTQHHITNRTFEIDGDAATSAAELFAPMGMAAGEGKMSMLFTGGVYNDTYRRTPDGWKISSRVCDRAWLGAGPEVTGPSSPS
jgi:hypothetical protein